MDFGRFRRGVVIASVLCGAMLSHGELHAVGFPEFVDPNPVTGNQFGATVVVLSTGNVVITSPFDDFGAPDAGAVYLFNGATGALISTLRGSSANDNVGSSGVIALTNGNYVVKSSGWNNGAALGAGAVTWGRGTTGVSGTVSPANSLVGSTANDFVGSGGGVTALPNGNYVVSSASWDNGTAVDAGAVTWGSGTSGVNGTISAANSLVGSTANDFVGNTGVTVLANGNYLVGSQSWDNGAAVDAGAATWASGTTGVSGPISAANSLVGSAANDAVGANVTLLSNGNYVVWSPFWDNGAIADAGAATWASGTSGVTGTISAANSLVGSQALSNVGVSVIALTNGNYVVSSPFWDNGAIGNAGAVSWANGATGVTGSISAANSLIGSVVNDRVGDIAVALPNGNYVVASPNWDNGAVINAGAATWGNGATGVTGAVSAANSLVGSRPSDQVGSAGVKALTNGNYVVVSTLCDNGAIGNAGAVSWGSGTGGAIGTVSAANSLVGSTLNDQVGNGGVTALSNGNYVVRTNSWNNGGAVSSAGAVTWGSGTTGVSGAVSAANSLVGSTAGDGVGTGGVVALTNGSYVVVSSNCDNGAIVDAGAVSWGSGTAGVSGTVSAANSLVGAAANDQVGNLGVTPLSNGNYVVRSTIWDNGAIANAGAATWGSGTTGVTGSISAFNSLVGSSANDNVGGGSVTALSNGNYLVASPNRDNGAITNVGAVTWGNGTTGVSGTISAANSLVGSTAVDQVGNVTALSNGDYVVLTVAWDNGALASAGAATWGSGTAGIIGAVSSANSLVGTAANTGLQLGVIEDVVNGTFFARFLTEGGGRVRVRVIDPSPVIVSATDIPNDQGGWLRLAFNRSALDDAIATPPVATYGVWRHVPGTLAANVGRPSASGALDPRTAHGVELLSALLPAGLDMRDAEGQLYLMGSGSVAIAAAFPPGTWALVTSVPALQQAQYVVDVPTISNAAPNDYVVTAHTTTPSIWFTSNTISGQSVDNLAPSQPTGLTAAYSSGQTHLQWSANTENDLGAYHLHRGASADFIPSPGNLIASQIASSYADVGPAGSFYKLSALDVNGNQSTFALMTPQQTTGVGDGEVVAFALHGARPNPANAHALHVAFALSTAAPARLELHDVSGRRVLSREVGSLGVGRHTVNLATGRRVATGIYWVSLSQGANQQRTRVAVVQ